MNHPRSKRKHVVLLVRNAAKQDFGGAETYPVSLAKLLTEEGWSPILVSRSHKLLTYANSQAVATRRGWWWSHQNWSGKRALLFPAYVIWQLVLSVWYVQLIIRTGASVVHAQSRDDFIAATIACRLTSRVVVWTDHMDLRYVYENIAKPFRNPVGKFVFWISRFAHHIILISENEYNLVTSHFAHKDARKKQIVLVKNGVIDLGKAHARTHANPVVFCLASRMVVNKGVGEAIQAFIGLQQQLSGTTYAAKLAIYGDGPDLDTFKKLAEANRDITFYGHQDNAIEKVRAADVFVLPSYQEGFSIALLEATMLGKAIIASDVDSNPEIIVDQKTGLLIRPRDIASLQQAMYIMATNETLRHQLEKRARAAYEKSFDLRRVVKQQILPLYSK